MTEAEIIACLRLQAVPNIGDLTAKKLIAYCGCPTAVFQDKKSHLLKIEGIGKYTLKGLFDKVYQDEAEEEWQYISSNDVALSYFMDDGYPEMLKHCLDGPIVLFQRGNIDLKGKKLISVVGTRNITSQGRLFCENFIEEITPLNPVIISGFAYGVDITIQRMAMEAGLQTIGCLAHGLNQIYPKSHKKYAQSVELNGGFCTEFWSSSQPDRENFLKRNRIIAGMSQATVVIESAEKGGSLITANLAHDYNREVFALPGRHTDKFSAGCNNLIKQQKAQLLTSAADLVYMLNWKLQQEPKRPVQRELFVQLDETEKSIYSYLQLNGKQLLDVVALDCKLPVHLVSSVLLGMEMKGVIRPLPGKLFEAI
ncbi:DNA-processing protein DprA [Flagellimonas flava]|uniref:DNA processing protein n=1 Tax=Flagellimonas flava TaxID=570519 RepID=A0A1M5Q2L1_9FLAO|nr:DNA-processing protein DprA [Allomuricauda flava]SHH08170.1 DNA processing protein [Allomuricauda flava]